MHMAEVILTADRLTYAEAKRVSKDLIGELAPDFTLTDDAGNSLTAVASMVHGDFSSSMQKTALQHASVGA